MPATSLHMHPSTRSKAECEKPRTPVTTQENTETCDSRVPSTIYLQWCATRVSGAVAKGHRLTQKNCLSAYSPNKLRTSRYDKKKKTHSGQKCRNNTWYDPLEVIVK